MITSLFSLENSMKELNNNLYFLINSLHGGGAERVAVNLLKVLSVKKVYLLEKDIKYETNAHIEILSNHTIRTNPIFKMLYIPIYALKLSKRIKRGDKVVSFLERANFVNVVSKFLKPHKAIISVHTNPDKGFTGSKIFVKFLVKLLYPRADLIIAVSKDVAYSLQRLGIPKDKIKVIYNPIEIDKIEALSNESIEDFFSDFIITVGRLDKPKGQWYLLRIFKELKKNFASLKLLILGEGELKEYLVSLSEKLGLKTYVWDRDDLKDGYDVYFMGFQANPFKYLSKAKIFVFPSLWEGLPNTLIEAMACGMTVVSADCRSGPREILAPDTDFRCQTTKPEFAKYGILLPVFNVEYKKASDPLTDKEKVWLETLTEILENESLRKEYAERAKQRAEDFRVEKIVEKWKEVLF